MLGLPGDYYGERVAAAVVLATLASAADLQEFCRDRITRFKAPAEFFRTRAFPLTPSGKIRKTVIREQADQGALSPLP